MATSSNIYAGVSAGGTSGAELAYFAPVGTTMPDDTNPFAAIPAAFQSAGYCTQDGFSLTQDLSKEELYAFGVQSPVRVLKTQMKTTGSITFMETNPVTLAVYNSFPLTGAGALVVGTDGTVVVPTGQIRSQRYACIIDTRDGENRLRLLIPELEVFPSGDLKLSMGAALERGVEMSAYPDQDGVAIYEAYKFLSLASATPGP